MKTPDISGLVAGILAAIGIAISLGQYGKLEAWARHQAMEAMAWKQDLPYFFAPARGLSQKANSRDHSHTRHRRPEVTPFKSAENSH